MRVKLWGVILMAVCMCCMLSSCRLLRRSCTSIVTDGTISYESKYSYDKNGNLIEKETIYALGITDTITYEYDENGNLICEKSDGLLGEITSYTYDSKGNLIIKKREPVVLGKREYYGYAYNADGKIILAHWETEDDSRNLVLNRLEYKYDENGRLIEIVNVSSDPDEVVESYIYDGNGNVISKTCTDYEGGIEINEFSYDDDGKLILQKCTYINEEKTEIETSEYTYNKKGRLSKKVTIIEGEEPNITVYYVYNLKGRLINEYAFESE